jgi:hypothetical protein
MLGVQIARGLNQCVLFQNTGRVGEASVDECCGPIKSPVCVNVLPLANLKLGNGLVPIFGTNSEAVGDR